MSSRFRKREGRTGDAIVGKSEESFREGPWYATYIETVSHLYGSSPVISRAVCYDEVHSGPPYMDGGPFNKWEWRTNGRSAIQGGTNYIIPDGVYRYRYSGGFLPFTLDQYFSSAVNSWATNPGVSPQCPGGANSWGDYSSHGATAWKRYRPGKNTAEAGIFIGEIRDLPRMLYSTAKKFRDAYYMRFGRSPRGKAKVIADSWLTAQFGWLPFISDLRRFYKTWRDADAVITQLKRDNGQWIKRGGSMTSEEDSVVVRSENAGGNPGQLLVHPYINPGFFQPNNCGQSVVTRITRDRIWFEARFRYWIPNIESVQWKKKALAQLYGAQLDPSVVWELIPWSWLIDWFTNVGDVISNVSNTGLAQNLAAKYAYLMGTKEEVIRQETTFHFRSGTQRCSWESSLSRKTRTEANPFGFGVTYDGLSARQWSILSALGITRMH